MKGLLNLIKSSTTSEQRRKTWDCFTAVEMSSRALVGKESGPFNIFYLKTDKE